MIVQVKEDIKELQRLQAQATRRHVIDILSLEIRRLDTDLIRLQDQIVNTPSPASAEHNSSSNTSAPKRYLVKLNGYGKKSPDLLVLR